ncbi:unnamed protein product, partial [Mesorhabditis belari]|uniref:Uncharacterized protein n=1 Tax=Mesorhabditis belari TaxID=2138241 RepID=A0AAF3FRB4_9BILA
MTSLADSLFNNHESGDEISPKRNEDNASPTDDPQIGDIGALAIQQLAASQAASPTITEDVEREMSTLERDIKRQKESSVNAKTAITFDQLKKIHQIGKVLGPAKEQFYDRICRAADIQRASLKNRLKQNKEKFEPGPFSSSNSQYSLRNQGGAAPAISVDSPIAAEVPSSVFNLNGTFANGGFNPFIFATPPEMPIDCKPQNFMRAPIGGMENRSISPGSTADEDSVKIPVERVNELFQLGFTYDEVKEFNSLFEQFKQLSKDVCPPAQLLTAFSNFISQSVPDPLKLICTTFNLLEMGYTRREMLKIVNKERRNRLEDDGEVKVPFTKRQCFGDGESNDS